VEENFTLQEEDDRGFSHPNKPSLSAAHLRKQVLALGLCGASQLLIAIAGEIVSSFSDLVEKMNQILLFVFGS